MNEYVIITTYVVIVDVLKQAGHESHCLAQMTDAQILTIAVIAAVYFQNHHERALCVMQGMGYVKQRLSISRFNRRLHQLMGWLQAILLIMGEVFAHGEVFIIDSLPVPVCKRVRAIRCRKVRGRAYCGYCAAKKERFFGWRLHLVCSPDGLPVAFDLLPAAYHDLTPIHELTFNLPSGACVYLDKAYNSKPDEVSILAACGVRLIPIRRDNMQPHDWVDDYDLRLYRHSIETVNSQLESMGIQRLHARSNSGFEIKVYASLLALALINLN
jgi:DDE family transposase